jgi:PAS domain S-box-containing protein
MADALKVLIVEDSEDDAKLIALALRREGFDVHYECVDRPEEMRDALQQNDWDVIISDYQMPAFDGLAALAIYQEINIDIPFIIVSGAIGEETAVRVMKAGAHDYLIKDNLARLGPAIRRELHETELRKERREALRELQRSEARYRAIVEDQTELIVRYAPDGVFTYTNEAYARLHGRETQEIIGEKRDSFIPVAGRENWSEIHTSLSRENPVVTSEVSYIRPDGQVVWIQWRDRLILDAEGHPIEFQGVGRDITDLKLAETELKTVADNLERRAVQLQVAAEVARDAAMARELDALLNRAVNLVRERFGFYYAGVFLIDDAREYAVLTAATGEAGQQLLEKGHSLKIGEIGIVGFVAESGEPRVVPDVRADTVYFRQPLLPETRSEMALPLKVGDRVIGVLDVQSHFEGGFDEEDVRVLQTMADQLAVAIDNVRLFNEVQHRAKELEGLYDAALVTSSELDTDTLLMRLYEQVQRFISPDTFFLALYESETDEVHIVLAMESGRPEKNFQGKRFRVDNGGFSGWVVRNRRSLLIGDIESDPLPVEPIRTPHEKPPVTRAWLGVPLIVRDQIIGVASIQSFEANVFNEGHRRFLESLVSQAAIAIENARLFAAEREAREQAETLREIARAIGGSLELDSVLALILEQLQRVLTFDTASVLVYVEKGKTALVAGTGYQNAVQTNKAAAELLPDSLILQKMSQDLEPVIIPDVREHPDWIWIPGAKKIRSFLGVPIIIREMMVGAFMVDSLQENFFTSNDAHTVQTIAQHMAIAIETARLFEAERSQLLLARTLQEVGMLLTSQLTLEEVLERILDLLGRVVKYDSLTVQLFDENQQLYMAAGRGLPESESVDQNNRRLSDHFMQMLNLVDRQAVVIPNTCQDNRWVSDPSADYIQSWIGAPLLVRGNLIGILTVASRTPNIYDKEISETVMAFTNQAAIAIGNSQLFEAERLARERAEALREAAQVISSILSLDQVVETVLTLMARVLSFDSGCVIMVEKGHSYVQAGYGYENFVDVNLLSAIQFDASVETVNSVVRDEKLVMIPDVRKDPRWQMTPVSDHILSWLGVPLLVRDQVIGLFSLDRTTVGGFSDEEISLVQLFASHTSAAIENARLFETAERRAAELEILRQVGLRLTVSLELKSVFGAVLNGVFKLMPDAYDAHIFTYDQGELIFGSALSFDGPLDKPIAEPRPEGLTYTVARSGETLVVTDMQTHPLFKDVIEKEGWSGAILGLPLKIGMRVVGVINIAFGSPRIFSEAELRLLGLLGDQAALAIENSHLFEQTTIERRHIALLYDVSRAIASSFNTGEILTRAIDLTCQALGGVVGVAWVYLPDEKSLQMRALYNQKIIPLETLAPTDKRFMSIDEGLAGWVAREGQPVNVPDVLEDPRWKQVLDIENDVHATICAPILEGDTLLGVLAVQHNRVSAFTDDHLDLLQAICQQVGLALSNARRYQDIDRLVNLLAAEQQRLEGLIETLPVGVLLLDQDHKLLVANSLGREIIATLAQSNSNGALTRFGPHPISALLARHTESLPVEIVKEEPPRSIYEVQARAIGGEAPQWVLTLRDVTQEREIQERSQIQERLATVGQLAAGIAHDFNNIMAAIVVYADLLLLDPDLSSASHERLTIIQQQVQRAASLIRQILDFSRRSVMEQSKFDLLPFLKEMEKLLGRTLPETIRVDLIGDEKEYLIIGDPTRLQQVFMNLAVNSRDAMPDGGKLSFELDIYESAAGDTFPAPDIPPGTWIRISVSDTGCGIAPDNLSHIFEPFFTTKPVGQGTGLGLAQVYGIVKQHDGYIFPHSVVGKGTTFNIYLPALTKGDADADILDTSGRIDGAGKPVLLVEDDQATCTALQTLLNAYNYQVFPAANGLEALEILDQQGSVIELVISDIVMPEMGGMDLYAVLQGRWPGIKILFITGHPLDSGDQNILEQGSVNWLQKPFTVEEFSQTVQAILDEPAN